MKLVYKFIILVSAVLILTGLALSFSIGYMVDREFTAVGKKWSQVLSSSLAEGIANDTINGNRIHATQTLVNLIEMNDELFYAYVVDFDGRLFAHTFNNGFPQKLLRNIDADSSGRTNQVSEFVVDGVPVLETAHPIISGMNSQVYLGINKAMNSRIARTLRTNIIYIILLVGIIGVLASILLSRRIAKPLEDLTKFILSYGHSNEPDLLSLTESTKEISALWQSFQSMIEARTASEHKIILLNEELELRVEQRTAELEAANVHLQTSIQQLNKTQDQLVQSEKMASLGSLVAGVAHEINTPVGVGVTAVSHLKMKIEGYTQRYQAGSLTRNDFESFLKTTCESSDIIEVNLSRAAGLIRSFKQVAVDQSSNELRSFNLKEYLQEILQSLKPKIKSGNHRVSIDCPDDIVMHSHPGALSQVITNLVINSIVHGFDGNNHGSIKINVSEKPTGTIRLDYSDDGKGIVEENVAKIFEPFFTTARGKGGSGLGMHIVYNLVNQTMGGKIECSSFEGEGARFHLELPSADRQQMLQRHAQGA